MDIQKVFPMLNSLQMEVSWFHLLTMVPFVFGSSSRFKS